MSMKAFLFCAIGIAILAFVIFAPSPDSIDDNSSPSAHVPTGAPPLSPATPAPIIGGTQLPPIHNSVDTHCDYERQCTDDEFGRILNGLQKQWAMVPEWLRAKCISNSTFPSIENCILSQTVSWLKENPSEQAPWVNLDNLGEISKEVDK
jgi:hypothetical protein